jgi:hypothetical protein
VGVNHFENEFRSEEQELIESTEGYSEDRLRAAYEDFAEKVAKGLAKLNGVDELDDDYFSSRPPIRTRVEIEVAPHNNWVKAYWVKAY